MPIFQIHQRWLCHTPHFRTTGSSPSRTPSLSSIQHCQWHNLFSNQDSCPTVRSLSTTRPRLYQQQQYLNGRDLPRLPASLTPCQSWPSRIVRNRHRTRSGDEMPSPSRTPIPPCSSSTTQIWRTSLNIRITKMHLRAPFCSSEWRSSKSDLEAPLSAT